jgi:hypothetical protein
MVPIFVHRIDNILEQVFGIFEGMINPSQALLQAIDIQIAPSLGVQTLPESLYPRIPRVLGLWGLHVLLRHGLVLRVEHGEEIVQETNCPSPATSFHRCGDGYRREILPDTKCELTKEKMVKNNQPSILGRQNWF